MMPRAQYYTPFRIASFVLVLAVGLTLVQVPINAAQEFPREGQLVEEVEFVLPLSSRGKIGIYGPVPMPIAAEGITDSLFESLRAWVELTSGQDLRTRRSDVIYSEKCLGQSNLAFLVPATILGLGIGPAVAVHEGSTLLVVINALRLLAYRDPAGKAA